MKRMHRFSIFITAVLSALVCACLVQAASMSIRFSDGRIVVHDTNRISSITFDGGVPQTSQPEMGTFLLNEDFLAGLSTIWEPIQVVGGNFSRFATVAHGKLAVSVPANNSWGKTGIMSRTPLFSVDSGMAANPLKLAFEFVPEQTSGYIIALSQAKDADVWRAQNYWLHWGQPSIISGKIYAANTQNSADKGSEAATPPQAPGTITLAIRPGSVEATTSQGARLSMNLSWLKPGVPVYLYVFSHPWNQHGAAAFALKSIRVSQ